MLLAAHIVVAEPTRLTEQLLKDVGARFGRAAKSRLLDWQNLMASSKDESETEKLERVNDFFNRIRHISDEDHWGKRDYWATPVEMLATNGGDCEDFSIAKYFTLKQMGVSVDQMRITYVRALNLRQTHMVVAYYPSPDAEPMILDNLIDEIKPGSKRDDLLPVYSFNGDGLWMAAERGQGKRVGRPQSISLWRDMQARMKRQTWLGRDAAADAAGDDVSSTQQVTQR